MRIVPGACIVKEKDKIRGLAAVTQAGTVLEDLTAQIQLHTEVNASREPIALKVRFWSHLLLAILKDGSRSLSCFGREKNI